MNEANNLNPLLQFDDLESPQLGFSQRDSLQVFPYKGSVGQLMSVYLISNTYHQKYYVGKTLNTRNRIFEHWNSLIRGNSTIHELQDDCKEIQANNFKLEDYIFFTLVYHKSFIYVDNQTLSEYNTEIKRLENETIQKLKDKVTLYNSSDFNYQVKDSETYSFTKVPSNSSPCLVYDVPYPSYTVAAKAIGIDKQALARRAEDDNNLDFINISRERYFELLAEQEEGMLESSEQETVRDFKPKPKPNYTGIQYNDLFDESIVINSPSIRKFKEDMGLFLNDLPSDEKEKRNKLQIFRTMVNNNQEIEKCKYTRLLSTEEFYSYFPNQDKRSGISRKVKIDGTIFKSTNKAAAFYNVTRNTITSWCNKGKTSTGKKCEFI